MAASEPRRFFLEGDPHSGPLRLAEGEAEHASRVLRLRAGDSALGLDGRGGVWPLRVASAGKGEFAVESAGAPTREPAPGAPLAPLPWIEVAVAWPRANRADDMVDALVQLGAAAIQPLACAHAGPQAQGELRRERVERILREALKQCRRAWLPELGEPCTPAELARRRKDARIAVLHPTAALGLHEWCRIQSARADAGTAERPLVLAIGPEGGFSGEELEALRAGGAELATSGPHVQRIETAAAAALAICAAACWRGDQNPRRSRRDV